jgi:hypothetical protein
MGKMLLRITITPFVTADDWDTKSVVEMLPKGEAWDVKLAAAALKGALGAIRDQAADVADQYKMTAEQKKQFLAFIEDKN